MARIAVASQAPVISYAVTLPNGVRIHSAQQGPATGPALVLLHGFSDSSFSFSRIMPLLPAQLRVIAPDLRGHGDSSRPATGYGVADFADDVLQLMNTLNVPSAIVAGHSMGSFVAQALTERASNRVTHQVLVASAPDAVNDSTRELCSFVETLFDPINPDFVRGFQHGTVSKPVPQTFMDLAMATSQRMPTHIWKEAFRGLMNFKPVRRGPMCRRW